MGGGFEAVSQTMANSFLGYLLTILTAAACGYLLGSVNGAIVSVRLLKHEDVRKFGSHNAGLTNTIRCFGKGCGALTLIIDLTKAVAAMALAEFLGKTLGWAPLADGTGRDYRWLCYVAAFFAVLGHVFPLWHRFKGGKGVLCGVSAFLYISPLMFVILMAIFGLCLWRTKIVSLSSIIATASVIPLCFLTEHFARGATVFASLVYTGLITLTAALIIFSHRENIARLRAGTERRIGEKKKS